MEVVIDSAALLAVVLEEPERGALQAATVGVDLVAPASLPWEVGNALVAAVRRRRLTPVASDVAWTVYQSVPIRLLEIDIARAIKLARELRIYAYDAYMLELGRQRHAALLTLDIQLAKAASAVGIDLMEY